MNDHEGQSRSFEATQTTSQSVGESNAKAGEQLKKRRAQLRGKVTRSINRIKKFIEQGAEMRKRIERGILQVRKDFDLARECHAEMYEYVDESQISAMDDWEDVLTNDFYDVEETVENFLQSISEPKPANTMSLTSEQTSEQSMTNNSASSVDAGGSSEEINNTAPGENTVEVSQSQSEPNLEANETVPKTSLDILEPENAKNTNSEIASDIAHFRNLKPITICHHPDHSIVG